MALNYLHLPSFTLTVTELVCGQQDVAEVMAGDSPAQSGHLLWGEQTRKRPTALNTEDSCQQFHQGIASYQNPCEWLASGSKSVTLLELLDDWSPGPHLMAMTGEALSPSAASELYPPNCEIMHCNFKSISFVVICHIMISNACMCLNNWRYCFLNFSKLGMN